MANRAEPKPSRGRASKYAMNRRLNILHPDPRVNAALLPRPVLEREPIHLAVIISDFFHRLKIFSDPDKVDPTGFFAGDTPDRNIELQGLPALHVKGSVVVRMLRWSLNGWRRQYADAVYRRGPDYTAHRVRMQLEYVFELLNQAVKAYEERLGKPAPDKARRVRDLTIQGNSWYRAMALRVDERMDHLYDVTKSDHNLFRGMFDQRDDSLNRMALLYENELERYWQLTWWKYKIKGTISRSDIHPSMASLLDSMRYVHRPAFTVDLTGNNLFGTAAVNERTTAVTDPDLPCMGYLIEKFWSESGLYRNAPMRTIYSAIDTSTNELVEEALDNCRKSDQHEVQYRAPRTVDIPF